MDTLAELLGVDLDSPEMRRAELLAANDRRLLDELVRIRQARGLSQAAVGEIMGVTQPTVAAFEAYDSNPRLSSIRRYAHAVGALVRHQVEADTGQLADPARRAEWSTMGSSTIQTPGQPQERTTVRLAGAASFHGVVDDRSPSFALAA